MEITDKLLKPIVETKYLTMDNVDRYRTILRLFYQHYEKLKYWLYQEEVYEELAANEYFKDYKPEQCQQDLSALVEWKNLLTVQDTRKVSSIEEFKNKKFRYQLSEYSVEIERMVIKLENLFIEGASLEPSLLERLRKNLMKLSQVEGYNTNDTYSWWNDINNDFIRLNQNYQDYIRELNGIKAEEMMKTKAFLLFKDRLIEYLRSFIKSLQRNVGVIEELIIKADTDTLGKIFQRIIKYEQDIPRLDAEIHSSVFEEKIYGRWKSIRDWFVNGQNGQNEATKLFDTTNEIIRKITRYAAQISENSSMSANRREEYAKVAEIFMKCRDTNEAHRLSAMVFGVEKPTHLKGEFIRRTDSINSGVYDEEPLMVTVTPRIRNYREKASRTPIIDKTAEKEELKQQIFEKLERDKVILNSFIVDDRICFQKLPVIEPEIREVLLDWLSKGLETKEKSGKTEDGRVYYIDTSHISEECIVRCSDGDFTMPCLDIVFEA